MTLWEKPWTSGTPTFRSRSQDIAIMKQMHKHEAELCWAPLERKTMIQTLRFLKRLNCYSGIRVAVSSSWLFQWFARVISCLTTGFSYYWHRGQSIATILPKMWLYLQKFLFDGVVWSFMFGIKNACWIILVLDKPDVSTMWGPRGISWCWFIYNPI